MTDSKGIWRFVDCQRIVLPPPPPPPSQTGSYGLDK